MHSLRFYMMGIVALMFSMHSAFAYGSEIKVLCAVVMRSVLGDIASEFERASGHKVAIAFAAAGAIRDRVRGGEQADVIIVPRPTMNALLAESKIARGTEVVLARGTVGVSVRAGAPKPDIASVEGLKRSLLAAQFITYGDPAQGSASGVHFVQVLERLGIKKEIDAKTKRSPGASAGEVVANGEADIGVAGTMDLMSIAGIDFVGPLPAELQNTTDFVYFAAVLTNAKESEAGASLIKHLLSPAAARMIKVKGMEPG